jgi:peroxiredoxin
MHLKGKAMPKMKNCPVCKQSIKLEKMEEHIKKVHPRAKVAIDYTEKETKSLKEHEQRQKELTKPIGLWKIGAVIVVIIVMLAAITFLYPTQPGGGSGPIASGQQAPEFTAVDIDGNGITLSDLTNKPVYLDFFDTDCGHCRDHTEDVLVPIHDKYKDNITMISIDVGFIGGSDTVADIIQFKNQYNAHWTYILDNIPEGSSRGELANLYGVSSTPTDFIIDTTGKIVYSNAGAGVSYDDIAARLDALL